MLQKSALFYPRQVRAGWRRFYNIMQLSLASKRITRIPWKSCQYNIIHLTAFGGRGKALECNFSRRILYVEHKNWQILISDSGECGRPRLMAVGDANHKADQGSVKETWLGGYSCSSKDERKGIFDPLSMTLCRISQRVLTIHGARRHIWIWSTQKGWLCWARWTGSQTGSTKTVNHVKLSTSMTAREKRCLGRCANLLITKRCRQCFIRAGW